MGGTNVSRQSTVPDPDLEIIVIIIIIIIIIIIKMFNRHILALKMIYHVFTRFGKLQKPNWDWVYKIIKNS